MEGKKCQCGCGGLAPLAKGTNRRLGRVKGQPQKFISGHQNCHSHGWKDIEERFWANVIRGKPKECWLWVGSNKGGGYGQLGVEKRNMGAHRISWIIHNGPIPEGMQIRHKCDNPPCVNPNHLEIGTQMDNMKDLWRRGKNLSKKRGEGHPCAKLTVETIRDIRRLYRPRENGQELAKRFGVSISSIVLIAKKKNWRHLSA